MRQQSNPDTNQFNLDDEGDDNDTDYSDDVNTLSGGDDDDSGDEEDE